MKKINIFKGLSFVLIGGGALASVPIALTSCKGSGGSGGDDNASVHRVDKYITFASPIPAFGATSEMQAAGIQIGIVKDKSNLVIATTTQSPTGTDLIIDNWFKSNKDGTKLMLYNNGSQKLNAGSYVIPFTLAVIDGTLNLLEEMKLFLPLTVPA